MRKKAICILIVLLLLTFEAAAQQKYALVIGNGNYRHIDTLNNPRNDANDIGAALESLGWRVDIVLDATNKTQINNAVNNLKNRLAASRNSYGFVFYAGHAIQAGGENYLIPIDANYKDEAAMKQNAPSLQILLNGLNEAGNELNIVVMDACRDIPFSWAANNSPNPASGSRSVASEKPILRGLAPIEHQPTSSIIVFATAAGSVADDGVGRNGLYTSHFLNNMKIPGITVKDLIDKTGVDVFNASRGRQSPALYSDFNGVAYLGIRPPPVNLYDQLVNATGTTTITVTQDTVLPEITLSKAASITLRGDTVNRTISKSGEGGLIVVDKGVTLILENITLSGIRIYVLNGNLIMNNSTTITEAMVAVAPLGTFTMQGGTITHSDSFGVLVAKGRFNMEGGTITYCNLTGVELCLTGGTFIMKGGIIANNNGGGVSVGEGAISDANNTFIMENGRIEHNLGSGVCIEGAGTFIMNDGIIQNNISKYNGGGVYVSSNARFYMKGGSIGGNTANDNGGGVYVSRYERDKTEGVFNKTGGTIYGSNAGSNANLAKRGNAVYRNNLLIDYTY